MHKIFGVRQNVEYIDRQGAYLIPIQNDCIGVVQTPKGFFLLGGGLDEGETDAHCIHRECLEETGYTVRIKHKIGAAETYYIAPEIGYFHPIQTYYVGELVKKVQEPLESDHELVWVSFQELKGKMYLEMQNWAIEGSMKLNNKPIIAIRADGNETLGMGHLMRCMSIAKALEKQGAQCVFFVAQEQAGAFIREKGFDCEVLGTDYRDMEAELPRLREMVGRPQSRNVYHQETMDSQHDLAKRVEGDGQKEAYVNESVPRLWLVDSYQITQSYLQELQKMCPVFYLDDTGGKVFAADGLINYNIYGDELEYEAKCPSNMKLLLGAGYAPVKEEFVQTSYTVREDVQNVLITMGGSDKLNITGALSQSLLKRLPESIHLTLICGRFNPHLQELMQLQEENPRVHVLVDVADMWKHMSQADVAVSAAGSTMYELGAMGVPTVCCYYVENQRRIAEGFATKVGMCNAGDFSVEPEAVLERLTEAACELVADGAKRKALSERMKRVADGQGAVRIARELLGITCN